MKIYTKTGDKGQTSLFGGKRVSKDHQRVVVYGELDELNANISQSLNRIQTIRIRSFVKNLQHILFAIGSDIATPLSEEELRKVVEIDCRNFTIEIENEIDYWDSVLPKLKSFIIPGGSTGATSLHILRTICRRVERSCIQLVHTETINETIIPFINRLSDLFFILARAENYSLNVPDEIWNKDIKTLNVN